MKILYFSVHSVLEYDELRLFKLLGHDVFPLGVYFGLGATEPREDIFGFAAPVPLREPIAFNAEEHGLLARFDDDGCEFSYSSYPITNCVLTPTFVDRFDVLVVMHDLGFIATHWDLLSRRPVIWRTIGQELASLEKRAAELVMRGMRIVRYSPVERAIPGYAGETALIRFGKDASEFGPWTGEEAVVLTFANALRQRVPDIAAMYDAVTQGLPARIGGIGNDGMPGNLGLVGATAQRELYRASRAYFYTAGADIPYTLNLIEAMLSGMPLVALDAPSPYYEVPALLDAGGGLRAADPPAAAALLRRLLDDSEYAADVGARARAYATRTFDYGVVGKQWGALLDGLASV